MAEIKYTSTAGITELVNKVKSGLDGKVDKKAGYELTKNDLTDALKTNYDAAYTHSQAAHAPTNAEHNVIIGIKVNGTALTIGADRIAAIVTATKLSELTNDASFQTDDQVAAAISKALGTYYTKSDTDSKISTALSPYSTTAQMNTAISSALATYYTKSQTDTAIATAIAGAGHISYEVVSALPTADIKTNTIYLVKRSGGTAQEANDIYNEYMYINNNWEQLGNTAVDFSAYSTTAEMNTAIAAAIATCVKTADMVEITAAEIDALFAGSAT